MIKGFKYRKEFPVNITLNIDESELKRLQKIRASLSYEKGFEKPSIETLLQYILSPMETYIIDEVLSKVEYEMGLSKRLPSHLESYEMTSKRLTEETRKRVKANEKLLNEIIKGETKNAN